MIHQTQNVSDVVHAFPQTRSVFDRYGLKGCGGENGPVESLAFFARAHGIELEQLIHELQSAIDHPQEQAAKVVEAPSVADTIYRRFFKAAIVTTLSAGALWGAFLLISIAMNKSFTSISLFNVNAHGHAQIFGWVGLFVMGFAYQAFPRFKHTSLWRPNWAVASFYMMLIGIAGRVIAEPLHAYSFLRMMGVVASGFEFAAIVTFVTVIVQTFRCSGKSFVDHDYYILAALWWFVAQAVLDVFHYWQTTGAINERDLILQVATWQGPLRDFQVLGFAMTMILGVSQRFLPGMFGLPSSSSRRSLIVLPLLTFAILAKAGTFVMLMKTHQLIYVAFMYLSIILITISVLVLTKPWWNGLWGKAEAGTDDRSDRSFKFIRAAYIWLFITLAMMLFSPFYGALTHQPFSHAYFGATRHAITVGFISMMILGVSARVVPTLNGIDIRKLSSLLLPFVLLNVGCALRVSMQIMTDFHHWAYSVIGLSGICEVTAIAIWAGGLWKVMRKNMEQEISSAYILTVTPEDFVGRIVEAAPQLLDVFGKFGFTMLQNPVMRKTVARHTTIHQACRMHHVNESELLLALNQALRAK